MNNVNGTEQEAKLMITEYSLVKHSKRSDYTEVVVDWTTDWSGLRETRQALVEDGRTFLYWDLEIEHRDKIHPQEARVAAAEWSATYEYEQVQKDAKNLIRLLQGRIETIQRYVEQMPNVPEERRGRAAEQLWDTCYREIVTITQNAHLDSMNFDARKVQPTLDRLTSERAKLSDLIAKQVAEGIVERQSADAS